MNKADRIRLCKELIENDGHCISRWIDCSDCFLSTSYGHCCGRYDEALEIAKQKLKELQGGSMGELNLKGALKELKKCDTDYICTDAQREIKKVLEAFAGEEIKITYKRGDKFERNDSVIWTYVLSELHGGNYALICLEDGFQHRDSIKVNDNKNITQDELDSMCNPTYKFTLIEE